MADTHNPAEITLKPSYYWLAVGISALPAVIAIISLLIGSGIHFGPHFTLPYWAILIPACVLYYWASCFMIQTEEFGGITVLETPALELEQGFIYAPLWLTEVERFPRFLNQHQFPGEPEEISKIPDDEADRMREMFLRPIRITTAGEDNSDEDDPLNSRLTLEPTFTVISQTSRKGFFEFYTNIPGKSYPEKLRSLLQFMRDTGEMALNVEISSRNAAKVTSEKEIIAARVKQRLGDACESWGITICEVNVLGLEPDHATNIALANITRSKAEAKSAIVQADAYRKTTVTRAQGDGEARVISERSQGEGLKAKADASGVDAEKLLQLEAAIEIGKNNSKIILAGDLLDIGKQFVGALK